MKYKLSTADKWAVAALVTVAMYLVHHFAYKAGFAAGVAQERAVWNEGR